MKSILAATDLSERSDRAVARAALLADELGARLTVAHVVDDDLPNTYARRMEAEAEGLLRAQLGRLPGAAAKNAAVVVAPGRPHEEVLAAAEAAGAGLIVIGMHRNGVIEDLFRGSTAERLARASPLPLLVARFPAGGAYARAVVGVDFSIHARHALRAALDVAPRAALELVHAYTIPLKGLQSRGDETGEIPRKLARRQEEASGEEMRLFLAAAGVGADDVRLVYEEGGPDVALRRRVAETGADLLVVGTHGRGALARAILGSLAEDMLRDPPCDVLVVRAW